MGGNVKFDSSSASPEELGFVGSYPNGLRGSSRFDRCGSFREGGERRMYSPGDFPQFLMLDPITMGMGDQKYTKSGELRRALGISFGSNAEDNSFGAAHSKPPPPPPVATEELKRFKASVLDAFNKARSRKKKYDEHLNKLNKFLEALNSMKLQRNETLANERSGGSNLLKIGPHIHRNTQELVTQRLEDSTKNVLNKRVRSSVAETRSEGRSNNLARQPLVTGKERDILRDVEGSDLVEEKVRRLPAGGEGWDKKMKRKRSAGTVFIRAMDGDTEPKRHHKLNNEPVLQSCDAQSFRSGSPNGSSSIIKIESNSLSAGSNARAVLKNELEKETISRDFTPGLNKERFLAKGNNKLIHREDNGIVSSSPVAKGKASRAPRTGPLMAANSLPNFPRTSGAIEGWEQPPSVSKVQSIGGVNNRKRSMPTGSSSPPMAQWVGQRPHKISRTRKANLVSPVSTNDDVQISSEGCSPPDFGRITCIGTNGPPLANGMANGNQQFKVKQEKVTSPAKLSESEESGAGESHERFKGKLIGSSEVEEKPVNSVQNVGPVLHAKKNKMLNKEEIGDGVRRQGRSGRGSSFARASIPSSREKLENPSLTKPPRNSRPGSDKNESKSRRPLKKLSERKAFGRLGQMPAGSSPDTGESDDDREELLAAANFASNANYLACSGSYWKRMEPIFTNVSVDDACYLKQQVGDLVDKESFLSQPLVSEGREKGLVDQSGLEESPITAALSDTVCRALDSERMDKNAPLYQRILSALIVEDEIEEFGDGNGGRSMHFENSGDDSLGVSPLYIDDDTIYRDKIGFDRKAMLGIRAQKQSTVNKDSCNGSTIFNLVTRNHNRLCDDDLLQGDQSCMSSEYAMLPELHGNGAYVPPAAHMNDFGVSSFDYQYDRMCLDDKILLELQSIGLSLEPVPDLADGEDDGINKDIVELQKGLHQQVGRRKVQLNKIIKAVEEGVTMEGRGFEQVALNRLVELAYRKLLATRGSSAAKAGVPKVSKQVAFAFMKRTLARCKKFEDTGKSCFSEPALRDILYAVPHRNGDAEPINCIGSAVAEAESHDSQPQPKASGLCVNRADWNSLRNDKISSGSFDTGQTLSHPYDHGFAGLILNRGKKKELLLDDVGGGSPTLRPTSTFGSNTVLGGAKGKRSERDSQARSCGAKAGRPQGNFKGERKIKTKAKQKICQLSSPGNGSTESSNCGEVVSNKKREVGGLRSSIELPKLQLIECIEELGVVNELAGGAQEDLSCWFNFDEDGLQDHDSMGLEIPMDDLSDLNMLI